MKTQMIIGGILFGVAACTAPADGYRITGNIEGLVTEKPYCYNRQVSGNRRWEIR